MLALPRVQLRYFALHNRYSLVRKGCRYRAINPVRRFRWCDAPAVIAFTLGSAFKVWRNETLETSMGVGRKVKLAVGLLAGMAAAAGAAKAENEPVIVVPGRAGVPVMMNGIDVSGAVIEGDWGLNRPGVVTPTIIMRYWPRELYGVPGAYFPATGERPRYGRLEVIPPANRRLPPPAERYYRDWGIQSAPGPATLPTPYGHRRSHDEGTLYDEPSYGQRPARMTRNKSSAPSSASPPAMPHQPLMPQPVPPPHGP
jgi:hypothetical protein